MFLQKTCRVVVLLGGNMCRDGRRGRCTAFFSVQWVVDVHLCSTSRTLLGSWLLLASSTNQTRPRCTSSILTSGSAGAGCAGSRSRCALLFLLLPHLIAYPVRFATCILHCARKAQRIQPGSVLKDFDLFPDVHSPHLRNWLASQRTWHRTLWWHRSQRYDHAGIRMHSADTVIQWGRGGGFILAAYSCNSKSISYTPFASRIVCNRPVSRCLM